MNYPDTWATEDVLLTSASLTFANWNQIAEWLRVLMGCDKRLEEKFGAEAAIG